MFNHNKQKKALSKQEKALKEIESVKVLPDAYDLGKLVSAAEGTDEEQVNEMNKWALEDLKYRLENKHSCNKIDVIISNYRSQAINLFKAQLDNSGYLYEEYHGILYISL